MAGIQPSLNDREYDLWLRIASNMYDEAIARGITGLTPPSLNDRELDLIKKVTYYTAALANVQ